MKNRFALPDASAPVVFVTRFASADKPANTPHTVCVALVSFMGIAIWLLHSPLATAQVNSNRAAAEVSTKNTVDLVAAMKVSISREALGSGTPGSVGLENATLWDMNLYHAPQYLPGYPTAAAIYPRAINIQCVQNPSGLSCKGYNWLPEMGRAEYLLVRPVIVKSFSILD